MRRSACSPVIALCSAAALCASGRRHTTNGNSDAAYTPGHGVHVEHPIVQLPARSLWCKQYTIDATHVSRGDFSDMIARVKAARRYYQYPSLCAPQIGWNVQMFTLFDGSVFINPVNLDAADIAADAKRRGISFTEAEEQWMATRRRERSTCYAWEPCASCCFLMHYIERPCTVRVRAIGADGKPFEVQLDKMRARMALHELDHLNGVLFTRRIPDTNHVVPLEGFSSMSEWADDYPSLEARSTFLYTTFTPPYTFITDSVEDAQLLDRKFEDNVYPGCEFDRQMRIEHAAYEEIHRAKWRAERDRESHAEGDGNDHSLMREAREDISHENKTELEEQGE